MCEKFPLVKSIKKKIQSKYMNILLNLSRINKSYWISILITLVLIDGDCMNFYGFIHLNELCQCHAFPLSALECQFYLHLITLIFTPKNKVLTFVLHHLTLFLSTEKSSPFLRICKQSNKAVAHRESVTLKEYVNDFIVNFRCFSFLWFLSWRHWK